MGQHCIDRLCRIEHGHHQSDALRCAAGRFRSIESAAKCPAQASYDRDRWGRRFT